jgi:hypothetical protein
MTSTGASSDIPQQNSSELSSHITEKLDEDLTTSDEDDTEVAELCENCTRLDLGSRLRKDSRIIHIGPLTHYSCLVCPLCALVWNSVRLHWGPENPLVPRNEEPTLHMTWYDNNVCLYITQRPPGFSGSRHDAVFLGKEAFVISDLDLSYQESDIHIGELINRKMIRIRLDIVLLRRLIQHCTDHDLCRNRYLEKKTFLPGFRLIDVYEARLVETTIPCNYFALSYVWGGSQNTGLQTTKCNLDSLRQPSALNRDNRNHEERLPLTISDTIVLCRRLGQRYLWVDCLCIVQDDPEEKMRLIHGMGQVYENASLTIFAVSGSNADHGLAGVTARKELQRETICSIKTEAGRLMLAMTRTSLEAQIENSHWNTRGWTYQEQSLSERRLYLTAEEAFFVCRESSWREGYQRNEDIPQSPIEGFLLPNKIPNYSFDKRFVHVPSREDGSRRNWYSFISAVLVYTRKNLSYPEDALYAFSGIYDRFAGIDHADPGIIGTQGILLTSLPFSLFWYGAHGGKTKIGRRYGIHDIKLSSWSWASWIGPVDFVSHGEGPGTKNSDFMTRDPGYCWELLIWHHAAHAHFFVDHGFIAHRQRDVTIRANFSTSSFRPDLPPRSNVPFAEVSQRSVKERFDTKEQLLSIFPDKPQLCERHTEVGSLNFVAPCFAYPSGMTKSARIPRPGQQYLEFPGTNTVCCIIQLDSADEEIHDLALIYYDGSYQALCIKTVDGISTRVGLAVMSNEPEVWKTFIQSGLLTIEWKQIELR